MIINKKRDNQKPDKAFEYGELGLDKNAGKIAIAQFDEYKVKNRIGNSNKQPIPRSQHLNG